MNNEKPTYFTRYMQGKPFDIKTVASVSQTHVATVWRVLHDLPISTEKATALRQGLFHLTGEWYSYPIVTYEETEPT